MIKQGGCNFTYPTTLEPKYAKHLEERDQCRKYWQLAEKEVQAKLPNLLMELRAVYRIQVNDKYCYKDHLFEEKGWCQIAPDHPNWPSPNEWGFCSTSCDEHFLRVKIYHTVLLQNINIYLIILSKYQFHYFFNRFFLILGSR